MSDQYWISKTQLERIKACFPRSHGRPRVDDRRVISGIIHVIRNGLRWRDVPEVYGPHKTLYNRFMRWSQARRIRPHLRGTCQRRAGTRAHHDRRHTSESTPHCGEPSKKGDVPRRIGRTKGGLNSKLHAVCDDAGRPIIMLLSEGQMSDHKGARLLIDALPSGSILIGDKGYDSNWLRRALADRGIETCIPAIRGREQPVDHDKVL